MKKELVLLPLFLAMHSAFASEEEVRPFAHKAKAAQTRIEGGAGITVGRSPTSDSMGINAQVIRWNDGVGVGGFAGGSRWDSHTNKPSWGRLNIIGGQVGVEESYKTSEGEKGNRTILGRLAIEKIDSGNGKTFFDQRTILLGAYAEDLRKYTRIGVGEKNGITCLYGFQGSVMVPIAKQVSTDRKGVQALDRTYFEANFVHECPIDDDVSLRFKIGVQWFGEEGWAPTVGAQLRFNLSDGVVFYVGPKIAFGQGGGTTKNFGAGFYTGEAIRVEGREVREADATPSGQTIGGATVSVQSSSTTSTTQPVALRVDQGEFNKAMSGTGSAIRTPPAPFKTWEEFEKYIIGCKQCTSR